MAKQDFMTGFLQGLYNGGVGNPEVQERRRQSALSEAFTKNQMDANAREQGLMPAPDDESSKVNGVFDFLRNTLFPGAGKTMNTTYVQDPNAPSSYIDAKGNTTDKPVPGSTRLGPKETRDLRMALAKKEATPQLRMTPPQGYRFTPSGDLEAIPGGPADAKNQKANEKDRALLNGQLTQADLIMNKVDQALGKVSRWSAGAGALLAGLPTTDAKNLAATLDTIKANLGFQQLQEMRRSSPTGGALGAVSENELKALQSAVASLDQAQSPEQLKQNLSEIKTRYENWKSAVQQANEGGGAGGVPATKTATHRWNPATGKVEAY